MYIYILLLLYILLADIFCVGSSQIQIIEMKVESIEEIEERERIAFERVQSLWKDVSLLSLLPKEVFTKVADAFKPIRFTKGSTIIQQGEESDNFYIIKQGTADVFFFRRGNRIRLKTCGPNSYIGELDLINNCNYTATVVATSDYVDCLSLDQATFVNFVGPYIGAIGEEARKRDVQTIVNVLEKFPFFNLLPTDVHVALSNHLKNKSFHDGEVIIKEGDTENIVFYIILNGEVKITKNEDPTSVITILKNGDYFGELACLSKGPRSANVIANGLVETLYLDLPHFEEILSSYFIKSTSARSISEASSGLGIPKTEKYKSRHLNESKPLAPVSPQSAPRTRKPGASNRALQLYNNTFYIFIILLFFE